MIGCSPRIVERTKLEWLVGANDDEAAWRVRRGCLVPWSSGADLGHHPLATDCGQLTNREIRFVEDMQGILESLAASRKQTA